MLEKIIELVFLIDISESMKNDGDNIAPCYNTTIFSERFRKNATLVSAVAFNEYEHFGCDRIPIRDAGMINPKKLYFSGKTAFLDVLQNNINRYEIIHKYAREDDKPNKTIFVIISDGIDDASYKYSAKEISNLIERKKKEGWEFIFIGANRNMVVSNKEMQNVREGIKNETAKQKIIDSIVNFLYENEEEKEEDRK